MAYLLELMTCGWPNHRCGNRKKYQHTQLPITIVMNVALGTAIPFLPDRPSYLPHIAHSFLPLPIPPLYNYHNDILLFSLIPVYLHTCPCNHTSLTLVNQHADDLLFNMQLPVTSMHMHSDRPQQEREAAIRSF
jgi:hypothetical protein